MIELKNIFLDFQQEQTEQLNGLQQQHHLEKSRGCLLPPINKKMMFNQASISHKQKRKLQPIRNKLLNNVIGLKKKNDSKCSLQEEFIRRPIATLKGNREREIAENPKGQLAFIVHQKQISKNRQADLQDLLSNAAILGNYKMYSHLGKGVYSIVCSAVHVKTSQRCAIKTYSRLNQIQDYQMENIKRQVKHLFKLSHRNIVTLLHVIKDKQKLFLVMQEAGKHSLAGLLRKNKVFSQIKARAYFEQILQGISYCHAQQICHRDLKLQNILIDESNCVKIIDFGFSCNCRTKLNSYCGTAPYMAPEIINRICYNGKQTDIWSLGVVLYLLVVGKFPFRATSEKQLNRLILAGKFHFSDNLSPEIRAIITKMMSSNASTRPSAEQLRSDVWFSSI